MRRHPTIRFCIAALAVACVSTPCTRAQTSIDANPSVPRAQPAASKDAAADTVRATGEYIAGIDALEAGDYAGAGKHLDGALTIDPENADYYRARGVAFTLAEQFPAAIVDLKRAMQLNRGDDREADLWLGAAYTMSNDKQHGHFAHGGDVPEDYASLVYNEMAVSYCMSRYDHVVWDQAEERNRPVDQPIKTKFLPAARWYARRHKASGQTASQALIERVKANLAGENWAAALRDLQTLQAQFPDDATLESYTSRAELGIGDAFDARRDFTFDLTLAPGSAEGYLGRAEAEAILGDQPRMEADLSAAAEAGAKNIAETRTALLRILNQHPIDPDAPAHFQQAVAGKADFARLINSAVALRRWTNGRRERYDQAHQERIRLLWVAMQKEPNRADAADTLGWFIYCTNEVKRLWNGPTGDGTPVRPQGDADRANELHRAIAYADAALKIDPKCGGAMATKGWALEALADSAAGPAADYGLKLAPQNVPLLELKTKQLEDSAASSAAMAAGLRSSHRETHLEHRTDGVWQVTRTIPPSDADLASARMLEAQAAAMRRQAERLRADAQKVKTQVVPDLIKKSDEALRAGDTAAARTGLGQAYAMWPGAPGLLPRLTDICQKQGDVRWQQIYSALSQPMRETSAADELHAAWDAIGRTAWKEAEEALDRGASKDPSDAMVFAYRVVIDVAQGMRDPAALRAHSRAALALEEARARESATTFGELAPGQVDMLQPADVGLALVLHNRLAGALMALGDREGAIATLNANLELERRLGDEALVQPLADNLLPNPGSSEPTRPPPLAAVIAQSRLTLGRLLLASGKPAEAAKQFRKIRDYTANWPTTDEGRLALLEVDAAASLGQVQAAYATGDYEGAYQIMIRGKIPSNLSPEARKQVDALREKLQDIHNRR